MKLSIIIPCFNESRTINSLINNVKNIKIPNIKKEIIVVDDGSFDETNNLLKNIRNINLIVHSKNYGKGKAIKTGLKFSTGSIILIQDADLEYDPNDILLLIEKKMKKNIKVVYGSRILRKNSYSSLSFYLGGILLTKIVNILFPKAKLTDMHTCYKMFDRDVLESIKLDSNGFEFCPEITAKILKQNLKIYEVPISYHKQGLDYEVCKHFKLDLLKKPNLTRWNKINEIL